MLFERRAAHFIAAKSFEPRNMAAVTDEMKALIAACAVQITFGFSRYLFDDFYKIVVYPDNFHYSHYQKPFRGFVSDRGVIALSWQSFREDYQVYNDGVNIGLHELAHAIKLEKLTFDMDFTFYDNMAEWEDVVETQMERIRHKRPYTFRKTGLINQDEFFSVAVEAFFEIPEEVRKNFPQLFEQLCYIMNQNPVQKENPVLSTN